MPARIRLVNIADTEHRLWNNLDSVTAAYVDVRLDRKRIVLEAYLNAVHQKQ